MSAVVCLRFAVALLVYGAAGFLLGLPWWTGLLFAAAAEAAVFAAANFNRRRLRKWSGWGVIVALAVPTIPPIIFIGVAGLSSRYDQSLWMHPARKSYEPYENIVDRLSLSESWLAAAKTLFIVCGFSAAVLLFLWLLCAMIFERHSPAEEWAIRIGMLAVLAAFAAVYPA